ncbi:MAG: hypothetical protein FWC89_10660 [Defluviitaleaceae bacterium]|nr:hypothetical protein [Defluviitaleaceae bacterium]
MTFEEAEIALEEIASALPREIFDGLNGGYVLLPDLIVDKHGLLILGSYHVEPYGLGRYVTVHYGSLMEAYSYYSPRKFRDELKHVLHHELIHHLESLAGDKSLEIQDEIDRAQYLQNNLYRDDDLL